MPFKCIQTVLLLVLLVTLSSCSSWSAKEKEEAELHLRIGTNYLNNGEYPSALNELLLAESLDSSNPYIQNNLALAYFVRDRFELAEIHLKKALKLNSQFTDARNNLSRVYIERGKYNEGIKEASMVLEDLTYPSPEKAYLNLGMAFFYKKEFSKSRDNLQKSIELQRDNCLAQTYWGRTYYEQTKYSEAANALDRAAGFCKVTQTDEAIYYSGLSWYLFGKKSEAENRLNELLKDYPNGKYRDKAKEMLAVMKRAE